MRAPLADWAKGDKGASMTACIPCGSTSATMLATCDVLCDGKCACTGHAAAGMQFPKGRGFRRACPRQQSLCQQSCNPWNAPQGCMQHARHLRAMASSISMQAQPSLPQPAACPLWQQSPLHWGRPRIYKCCTHSVPGDGSLSAGLQRRAHACMLPMSTPCTHALAALALNASTS